jgi:hypothetical protein
MSREYKTILDLIHSQVNTDNDPVFVGIGTLDVEHLANMRRRRWLTLDELVELYKWKEGGRNRHLKDGILSNPDELIRQTSEAAFAEKEEYRRIARLDRLKGVGIAVASTILTVIDPYAYGIIDKRVWRLLHIYGEVDHDPEGLELCLDSWLDYLPKLRSWAKELHLTPREVERRLFEYKPRHAETLTYDTVGTSITTQLKEGAATQFMVHLDSVLDQIGQLPLEQQEVLADVLHRRRIEQVREQIAANARESLALFHAGKLQARPVEEVIASLEAALAEPDDE